MIGGEETGEHPFCPQFPGISHFFKSKRFGVQWHTTFP
jgi:hypothetical protein